LQRCCRCHSGIHNTTSEYEGTAEAGRAAPLTAGGGGGGGRHITPPALTRVGGGGVELDAVVLQRLQALGQQREAVAGHGAELEQVGWAVRRGRACCWGL